MSEADLALSIALGVGLAAAAGFRVFLPLLVMSVAAITGHLSLSEGFAWLASPTALAMLSAAALLEVLAYYILASIICSTRSPHSPGVPRSHHGSVPPRLAST